MGGYRCMNIEDAVNDPKFPYSIDRIKLSDHDEIIEIFNEHFQRLDIIYNNTATSKSLSLLSDRVSINNQ